MVISQERSKHFSGYKWPRSTNISPGESIDVKESVGLLFTLLYAVQVLRCQVIMLFSSKYCQITK
jgi:hypothetical protein